jgi:hypothetical protein
LVWNCGVVTSFMGLSAQALEGVTEVIRNGERLRNSPNTRNGIETSSLVLEPAIVCREKVVELFGSL